MFTIITVKVSILTMFDYSNIEIWGEDLKAFENYNKLLFIIFMILLLHIELTSKGFT